jgi:hypothetical protein
MTPIIVGLLAFVIAYNFFGKTVEVVQEIIPNAALECSNAINNKKVTDMIDSATFHLVGKNAIRLPQTDVFIDLARF